MKTKKQGNNWTAYRDPDTGRFFAEIMYTSREGREQYDYEITEDIYERLGTFRDDIENERLIKTSKMTYSFENTMYGTLGPERTVWDEEADEARRAAESKQDAGPREEEASPEATDPQEKEAPPKLPGSQKKRALRFIALRDMPELKDPAAEWFSGKWRVPKDAYLKCMDAYLSGETEYGWYLCLDGERIAGGLGAIENDFHDRKDLSPNICAVYTEKAYRKQGIAGALLNMAVDDLRAKGITPVYLLTDHTGFYERYGWEFLCMVQGDGEADMSRMYIHR